MGPQKNRANQPPPARLGDKNQTSDTAGTQLRPFEPSHRGLTSKACVAPRLRKQTYVRLGHRVPEEFLPHSRFFLFPPLFILLLQPCLSTLHFSPIYTLPSLLPQSISKFQSAQYNPPPSLLRNRRFLLLLTRRCQQTDLTYGTSSLRLLYAVSDDYLRTTNQLTASPSHQTTQSSSSRLILRQFAAVGFRGHGKTAGRHPAGASLRILSKSLLFASPPSARLLTLG